MLAVLQVCNKIPQEVQCGATSDKSSGAEGKYTVSGLHLIFQMDDSMFSCLCKVGCGRFSVVKHNTKLIYIANLIFLIAFTLFSDLKNLRLNWHYSTLGLDFSYRGYGGEKKIITILTFSSQVPTEIVLPKKCFISE